MQTLMRINSLLRLSESWQKIVKCSIICFVILFCYIYLFATDAKDHQFLITGSTVGFIASSIVVWNCILRRDSNGNMPPQISLLFWRAVCETGTGFRFILQPAFNLYVCHHLQCTRENGDPDRCAGPSFMWEFFVLASECWFLCNGLDLYYSITNPFFSFNKRVMYYHIFCWSTAFFAAASPFFLVPKWQEIYGFWYINPNIDDSANCWIKITWNNYAWPIWVYFFVPLLLIYMVCLSSLIVAYMRLRRGVTRSFLPRMRLLIMNTVNLVVHMLYWAVFVLFYAWTFWTKSQFKSGASQPTNNIIYFVMGSKGCSALLVWILTANNSHLGLTTQKEKSDDENISETIDANKALREEVLSFATAGIRSSARAGAKLTPDRKMITRRPQQHESTGSEAFRELINPGFFLRFILGYTDELRELEELVANKQRSVNETFMRQTVTVSSTSASVHVRNRTASSVSVVDSSGRETSRLSQRPTVVSGTDNVTRASPSMMQRFSMSFFQSHGAHDHDPSRMSDPENGLELDGFSGGNKESDRRSSSMIETVHQPGEAKQSAELFDLASTKEYFWRQVYNFFLDPSESVEFTEFEPYHFRRVRQSVGISDALYSMYFATTIKERLTQGGASGAFFFFSKGEKFIAKSCSGAELETLTHNAVAYADYMEANKESYISRIYGAYRLQIYGNALHFFVMNNIFLNAERLAMNEKYDIKGSWVARNATPPHNNMLVTCTYCEQKYVYSTKKKKVPAKRKIQRELIRSVSTDKNGSNENVSSHVLSNLADLGILNTTINSPMQSSQSQSQSAQAAQQAAPQFSNSRSYTKSGETQETDESGEERGGCPYTVSGEHEPNVILKDNDIKYKIRLPRNTTENLLTQIRADAEFLHSIGVMDYSLLVGVHNTEYEVMAEDPGSTTHTLVKAHSTSFGSSKEMPLTPHNLSSKGSSSQSTAQSSSQPSLNSQNRSDSESTTNSAPLDTKRPFADTDTGGPEENNSPSGSPITPTKGAQSGSSRTPTVTISPSPAAPARPSNVPNTNTTASAYLAAAAQYGLSTGLPGANATSGAASSTAASDGSSGLSSGYTGGFASAPHGTSNAAGKTPGGADSALHGGRNSMGMARLSRLSMGGMDGQSFASNSVAHSQDTENAGDLGFARKLEVYRVVGPDAYFMGIIDFQQKWTIAKRLERFIKVNFYGYDPDGTSAIEPTQYRDRFLKKVEDILDSDYAYQSRFVPTETPHDSNGR